MFLFLFLGERETTSIPTCLILTAKCVSIVVIPTVTIDGDPTQFKALGFEMQLTCRYNASPPVSEVLWEKDGTVIARNNATINSSRITIPRYNESQSQLTVLNATSQDAGNYTCSVTNSVGNSSDTTVIFIEGLFLTYKAINLTCSCLNCSHVCP